MSGVEAGATIVGLVGYGLTSLKTFYQFISNVKDGPEKVQDLANNLKSLQAAYERIQALGDLPGIFASSPSLTDLLKDCNENIERLQEKIGKLQVQPSDKFPGVVWKRLKMALNDDEIAQDLSILSSYVNKFTLEISVIELRLVHQNAGHMSQLVAGGERQMTMAKQQHTMLASIGTDMNSFIPHIQQVENGMNAVAVKITSMQSSSVGQAVGIAERLEKLERGKVLRASFSGREVGIGKLSSRPRDSKVFSFVKSGEKQELVRLLASGEASLQDRDDKGATLLHYAFEQPAMCQYLIEHGADVDDVASVGHLLEVNAWEPKEMLATPTFLASRASNECTFEMLILAGADLTIESEQVWERPFHHGKRIEYHSLWQSVLFNRRREGRFCTLIKHCAIFIDVNMELEEGRTSLHYLVYQIRRAGWTSEDDRRSLICLIQNGADIHSRDDAGSSIWDAAKKNNKQGSYARDMWDFVLAYCGFHSEVEVFARETPRHAVYRPGWYSRADFEEIWKGMEHLCPYYGDEASGLDCASFISETPSSSRRPSISDSCASTTSSIDGRDIDQMTPNQQQDLSEDESVKTWLSKSSVSSDMSDSPSVASLQYLGNTEVGFSEEVYENPWAEG
ncbi:Palmitoyltransferase AKR1 [Colletotrichum fructicola]|nr:Palmitoyltransferase AKR1 [Colletotrichum fructicola]